MENLVSIPCYRHSHCGDTSAIVFTSLGFLTDKLKDFGGLKYARNYIQGIETVTLFHCEGEELSTIPLVKCVGDLYIATEYYTPSAAAIANLEKKAAEKSTGVGHCWLNSYMYPEPVFPMEVTLEQSDRGGYITRINTAPNTFGIQVSGKIYCVDRVWEDKAWTGPALVTIKKETMNVGYLHGDMNVSGVLTEEEFRDYCWDRYLHPGIGIVSFTTPTGKRVVGFGHEDSRARLTVVRRDKYGLLEEITWKFTKEQWEKGAPMYQRYADFALQYQFGKEFSALAVLGPVTYCKYFPHTVAGAEYHNSYPPYVRIMGEWCALSMIKNSSELFNTAVSNALISVHTLGRTGIQCCEFNSNAFDRMSLFTEQELQELVQEVSAINTKANEDIQTRLRNGKLHLYRSVV